MKQSKTYGAILLKVKWVYKYLPVFVFVIIMIIPMLFVNFEQDKISSTENRTLANFPQIFDENGNYVLTKDGFEAWLNDNIGFRDELILTNAFFSEFILNKPADIKVQYGKDDFFYYTQGSNMEIAYGTYELTEEMLLKIADSQQRMYDALKEQGIDYVLTLPPSKVSIYPENIYGSLTVRETPADILADYLQDNTSVPVIRLKDALLDAKTEQRVYYKTDTHWNDRGMYVAYQKIIEDLYQFGFIEKEPEPVPVSAEEIEYKGDLANMLPNMKYMDGEEEVSLTVIQPSAVLTQPDTLNEIMESRQFLSSINTTTGDEEKESILIYCDSMMATGSISSYLSENFNNMDIYRFSSLYLSQIHMEDILKIKPDIVMVGMTERSILYLADESVDHSL